MQKKSSKSKSPKASEAPRKPRARARRTCIIRAEVEPAVASRLYHLCQMFNLPYPDGIAYVLEAACQIVGKRGASAATPAEKNSTTSKKARG